MSSFTAAAGVTGSRLPLHLSLQTLQLSATCMQGAIVDFVALALLVAFFGMQQRTRPQLYFRFWCAGWIFVLLGVLLGDIPFPGPSLHIAAELLRLNAIFLGGICFAVSLVTQTRGLFQTVRLALLVTVPAVVLLSLTAIAAGPRWFLFSLLLLSEVAAVHLIFLLIPRSWRHRRFALLTLCIVSTTAGSLFVGDPTLQHLITSILLAQVFFSAGILFAGFTRKPSVEWFAGTIGFTLWGVSSFISGYPAHASLPLLTLWQLWSLPKYAVGFAMTLRIFEGSRHDVVRMADRYKVLYQDFHLLYENHPLPMWIYEGASGRFLSVNAAACTSYGYTREEFLAMNVNQLLPQLESALPPARFDSPQPALPAPPSALPGSPASGSPVSDAPIQARHRRKDGTCLAAELTEHEILFQGKENARFVLALDVTEREKHNLELVRQAQHDPLTGLPNRFLLDDRIEQCLLRSARDHRKAVLFTIDADRFKLINDTYGHLVGDEALKAIAERLRGRIRSVDTIARTGGEEFTAIIGGLTHAEDAEKIAGMFVHLFDTPIALPGGQELKVSVSVGGAVFPDDAEDADALRRKSDQAVYHAKRLGRNRFAFISEEVCASFDQATAIELAIRYALRSDGFEMLFQPIFDERGRAVRFEALLRMSPQNETVYPPAVFIPVAEETGLIVQLGAWVVEEVARHLVRWREVLGDQLCVAINISGRQLLHKEFSSHIQETLREHGLPTSALQLELTETSLMVEPTLVRDTMAELAETGVQFAIDDFGTGYSSLARLAELPISLLKIDRSFVAQLDRTTRADGIVSAIIHMAQTLKVQVVAEGVEDEFQLNALLRKGCDLFQGFYLSTPLSAAEITSALYDRVPSLLAHPRFSETRVAVAKRVRNATQLPAFTVAAVVPEEGAA